MGTRGMCVPAGLDLRDLTGELSAEGGCEGCSTIHFYVVSSCCEVKTHPPFSHGLFFSAPVHFEGFKLGLVTSFDSSRHDLYCVS